MVNVPDLSGDANRPTGGVPDELSPDGQAFLAEIYAEPDPLDEWDLAELAAAEDERRQSSEILAALSGGRPVRDLLRIIFPVRRVSIVGEVRYA